MTALLDTVIDDETPLAELVSEAQAGDREALGEIVRRFQPAVYATALRRLGNESEAQELTQDVFMQLLRKIGQLREADCLGGWLRAITKRLAINRLVRGRVQFATGNEAVEARSSDAETPLEQVLRREEESRVQAGLERLGTMDRETLVAFYVRGQSLVEMSATFASPLGTIKRRLHVARKRLARELEELAPA